MRSSSLQYFAVKKWCLIDWKVGKDKVINKYKLSRMLLDNDQ